VLLLSIPARSAVIRRYALLGALNSSTSPEPPQLKATLIVVIYVIYYQSLTVQYSELAKLDHILLSSHTEENDSTMSCPYLKEVVMLYCQAYPVKKMIPLERIASAEPCLGREFEACPLFKDVLLRMRAHTQAAGVLQPAATAPREVFR
jgi:hypothetical protein